MTEERGRKKVEGQRETKIRDGGRENRKKTEKESHKSGKSERNSKMTEKTSRKQERSVLPIEIRPSYIKEENVLRQTDRQRRSGV